jgi:predicted Zn finger-like uncharacterized protein
MDINISCPHCKTKLIVEDDLIGELVACDECNQQFTVKKPADLGGRRAKPPSRQKPEEPSGPHKSAPTRTEDQPGSDDPSTPRSERAEYEDEDYRPVRRRPKQSSSNLAPIVFGSLLVTMTLMVGVGLFYAFGFGTAITPKSSATPTGVNAKRPGLNR